MPSRIRPMVGVWLRAVYTHLPIGNRFKLAIKGAIFRLFEPWVRDTNAHRRWKQFHLGASYSEAQVSVPVPPSGVDPRRLVLERHLGTLMSHSSTVRGAEYVAMPGNLEPPSRLAAKAIAFYLPQFHPIAENDEWWGRGFTEWTNVSKAMPQFVGHYQPRLPGELGFYDLRVVDVMRRQAELAKLYGIHGFCFHYYWFSGRRLLERPLDQLLENPDIDLPFCLCWANENWTRRWDGHQDDVLLGQSYAEEDDHRFIADAMRYLKDPRYIRLDGRPLLIVYRPSLLPDMQRTLGIWRKHCIEQGLGELFIAMVQFDLDDPRPMGFDAALEFPPHKIARRIHPINHRLQFVGDNYQGNVVEYSELVYNARNWPVPEYPLFRGVAPSWDNEARKPGKGYTFANSSPALYHEWLSNSIAYAEAHPVRGEHVVFINAWNEWAEGAHLEPDRKYGYAYLDATRRALQAPPRKEVLRRKPSAVCVVVHAFYPELLPEMFGYLKRWKLPYRLIITTVPDKAIAVREALEFHEMEGEVLVFANRGRDILPFLRAMERMGNEDNLILKLHTKRSLHRVDGEIWRKDLLQKLLDPDNAARILEAFREHDGLGLVAPEGHILPLSTYWGSNAETVKTLCDKMNAIGVDPDEALFAAGSMFYVRPAAITSILDLQLSDDDFEAEAGQVDGTLAHAIERCFSIVTWSSGHFLASSISPATIAYRSAERYAYAEPSH